MFGLGNAFGRFGAVPDIGGGFTPASIANQVFWIDPSQAATVTLNGLDVASIADISGDGHNASQGTAGRQPLYALANINGLNAITFTPAHLDNLQPASSTGLVQNVPGFSVFGIIRPTVDATTRTFVRFVTGLSAVRYDLIVVGTTGVLRMSTRRLDSDVSLSSANGNALATGVAQCFTCSVNYVTGEQRIRISGSAVVTSTASWVAGGNSDNTPSASQPLISLAAVSGMNGTLGEMSYYAQAFTAVDETNLFNYATAKWGTA